MPHIELMNMGGICETGPTVYNPYPESLTILAALSPELFE